MLARLKNFTSAHGHRQLHHTRAASHRQGAGRQGDVQSLCGGVRHCGAHLFPGDMVRLLGFWQQHRGVPAGQLHRP